MELAIEGNEEKITISLKGEIKSETCDNLRQAVLEVAGSAAPKVLEINLGEVSFIDTSGLGVLVGLRAHLKKNGTQLVVSEPQPKVHRVFELTQLSKLFGLDT